MLTNMILEFLKLANFDCAFVLRFMANERTFNSLKLLKFYLQNNVVYPYDG
jgi:hypothetical protein